MRRMWLTIQIVTILILGSAVPAYAAPPEHAASQHADQVEKAGHESTTSMAQDQSEKGMNRQGGPSSHPGQGWKDPGQDQGSPSNTADPDCTGNRTGSPQATNIGVCDDPTGAADEPAGPGGFDGDKDWNNGCGNDTDFEDDNNGQCRGVAGEDVPPPSPPPSPPPPKLPPKLPPPGPPSGGGGPPAQPPTGPGSVEVTTPPQPAIVAPSVPVPAVFETPIPQRPAVIETPIPQRPAVIETPIPQRPAVVEEPTGVGELPATGMNTADLVSMAVSLVAIGSILTRAGSRRRVRL